MLGLETNMFNSKIHRSSLIWKEHSKILTAKSSEAGGNLYFIYIYTYLYIEKDYILRFDTLYPEI